MCIEAFTNRPYNVLIACGRNTKIQISVRPENIHIEPYVNQIEVLKKASVFVTHAGMNSLSESLYHGVPMVLRPVAQEQKINAARLEELGAGKYCKRDGLTPKLIFEIVEEVATEPSYKKAVDKIGKTLHDAGGPAKAVERIVALL